MPIESLKSSMDYTKDLQTAMQSNPLKQESTNENDRESAIKENAGKIDAKSLMTSYVMQFQMNVSISAETSLSAQNGVSLLSGSAMENADKLNQILSGLDLKEIGYNGKPLQDLTKEEAQALVSEDGFFGITQTSDRIADFVLLGAGDDIEKLKAGREGILRGYNQAQKAWGDDLPEISQKTLEKALEKVDQKLSSLGANVLDQNA